MVKQLTYITCIHLLCLNEIAFHLFLPGLMHEDTNMILLGTLHSQGMSEASFLTLFPTKMDVSTDIQTRSWRKHRYYEKYSN